MNAKTILYTITAFGLPVLLLWCFNFPKCERYKQYWAPRAALTITLAVIVAFNIYLDLIRDFLAMISFFLPSGFQLSFPKYFNWIVLVIFVLIKGFVNGLILLAETLQKVWRRLKSMIFRQVVHEVLPGKGIGPAEKVPPAYEFVPGLGIMLRREWFFPGTALLLFAGLAVVLFICYALAPDDWIAFPFLPVVSVLLLCEGAWYLQGMRTGLVGVSADYVDITTAKFSNLWEKYQEIWKDRVIAAAQISSKVDTTHLETIKEIRELLANGENLLIPATDYTPVLKELFAYLWECLVNGKKIVVLINSQKDLQPLHKLLSQFILNNLAAVSITGAEWNIQEYEQLARGNQSLDVLLVTPEILAANHYHALNNKWFREVRLVLVPDVCMTFGCLLEVNTIRHALKDKYQQSIQFLMLSEMRQFLETALRLNFAVEMKEKVLKNPLPPQRQIILWKREGESFFQNYIATHDSPKYLGAEVVLSSLAWSYKVKPVIQLNQDALPWYQRAEELQNLLNENFFQLYHKMSMEGAATEAVVFDYRHAPWVHSAERTSCIVVSDIKYNLTATLNQSLSKATDSVFVNVVSPPYILRDYLASNIEYFQQHPLLPLSPRLSSVPYTITMSLMGRMTISEIDGHDLLSQLRGIDSSVVNVKDGLTLLFNRIFGIDILNGNLLKTERKVFSFDEGKHQLHDEGTTFYSLSGEIYEAASARLKWMICYKLIDKKSGSELTEISGDHLYQTYLPGQIHAFRGNPYCVRDIDHKIHRINLEFQHNSSDFIYRPDLMLTIKELRTLSPVSPAFSEEQIFSSWTMKRELCEAKIGVATSGYFKFSNKVSINDPVATYISLAGETKIPEREYGFARVLKMSFTSEDASKDGRKIAFTLSTLLNEMFLSFFPETFRFLHAGTILQEPALFFQTNQAMAKLVPQFVFSEEDTETLKEPSRIADDNKRLASLLRLETDARDGIVIIFAEDSHADMGLVQCLFTEWREVFALLYDYLAWLETGETLSRGEDWRKSGITNYEFLCFGNSQIPDQLDITGTLAFLESLGLNEQNSLGGQRRAFYAGEKDREFTLSPDVSVTSIESQGSSIEFGERVGDLHQCDFCGRKAKAKDMQLIDGMLERCQECSAKAVSEFSELVAIYNEARVFLERDMQTRLRDNINVRFASTTTVQKESGISFIPTSSLDPRALGVAILEGDNRTILIENGSPSYSILATTVHELTHIWQYDALNFSKMKEDHGLLLTEGLAMWAEVACLTKKKLAPELCAREKSRSDVYGQGYRAIVELLKKKPKYRNPFEIILEMYKK